MGQRAHLQLLSSRALSNCCPAAARWPELMELTPVESAEKDSPADVSLDRPMDARPLSFLLLGLTAAGQSGIETSCRHQTCGTVNALRPGCHHICIYQEASLACRTCRRLHRGIAMCLVLSSQQNLGCSGLADLLGSLMTECLGSLSKKAVANDMHASAG